MWWGNISDVPGITRTILYIPERQFEYIPEVDYTK